MVKEGKIEKRLSQEKKGKEEEIKLKDFNVEEFFTTRGKTDVYFDAPSKFEARADEEVSYDDLIKEVVDNIRHFKFSDEQMLQYREIGRDHELLFERDAKVSSRAIDEKNNLAAFTLLQEIKIVGGMNWREAIYVIEKNKDKIEGRMIDYNSGYHTSTWLGGEEGENEGSGLLIKEIKDGVLKYDLKTKDGSHEKEVNLKKEE